MKRERLKRKRRDRILENHCSTTAWILKRKALAKLLRDVTKESIALTSRFCLPYTVCERHPKMWMPFIIGPFGWQFEYSNSESHALNFRRINNLQSLLLILLSAFTAVDKEKWQDVEPPFEGLLLFVNLVSLTIPILNNCNNWEHC